MLFGNFKDHVLLGSNLLMNGFSLSTCKDFLQYILSLLYFSLCDINKQTNDKHHECSNCEM